MKLVFDSEKQMLAWLKGSNDGQRILAEIRDANIETMMAEVIHDKRHEQLREAVLERAGKTQHVLIEVFPDAWCEVYGPRSVRVCVVKRPRTSDPWDARLYRLTESRLKNPYKEIYWPSNRLTTFSSRVPSLQQEVEHAEYMIQWSKAFKK